MWPIHWKTKSYHNANFVVIGRTAGCRKTTSAAASDDKVTITKTTKSQCLKYTLKFNFSSPNLRPSCPATCTSLTAARLHPQRGWRSWRPAWMWISRSLTPWIKHMRSGSLRWGRGSPLSMPFGQNTLSIYICICILVDEKFYIMKFHWRLSIRVQLTITHQWFR